MGLDYGNHGFINHIKTGKIDHTKKLHWKECTPQQRRQHFLYWIIAAEEEKSSINSHWLFKAYKTYLDYLELKNKTQS